MTNDKSRNMQVVLRVRPLSRREMEQNQRSIIRVADTGTIIFDPDDDEDEFFFHGAKQTHRDITKRVNKNLTMTFDRVFDNQATNIDVFEFSMRPLVQSVMQGYNCSAFVYGATGAGKTYTMLGSETNPGITYLTMKDLFDQIEAHSNERKFDIGISYLEVYNEQVMNLLTKTGPLRLREDSHGVVVSGLVLKAIHDADELLSLLALGNRNRTQHPTDANAESSRSHAIFQVHIRMTNKMSGEKRTVKLSMIDLAGSERGSSTKCIGQRFKEGASINKSLLALGNCINKLADGSKHIPYRDSNMTRILKDSLGGNCRTVMIANISPSSLTYEDTYNTLKYAQRAQKIRTGTITQNMFKSNLPKEYYVRKLTDSAAEVEDLKKCIESLRAQMAEQKSKNNIDNNNSEKVGWNNLMSQFETWKGKLDATYEDVILAQENYYKMSSKEKLLKLRTKLKEAADHKRKLFNIDNDSLKRDIAKVEASIDTFSKQMEVYRTDKERWMERFKGHSIYLDKLQKEAEQTKNPIVLAYLSTKAIEHKNLEFKLKYDHTSKINQIYSQEMEKSRNTIELSNEILQDAYTVLNAHLLVTDNMRSKLNNIYKSYDQRSIKFTDADDNEHKDFDSAPNHNRSEYNLDTLASFHERDSIDDINNMSKVMAPLKRGRSSNEEHNESNPMKKRAVRSIFETQNGVLNATQVLDTHDHLTTNESSMDSTFAIKPQKSALKSSNATVTRPLKESNPNVHKDFVVPRPVIKPVTKVKSTLVGIRREKENKRTPSKVRRSPRRNSPTNALKSMIRAKPKPIDVFNKRREEMAMRLKAITKK